MTEPTENGPMEESTQDLTFSCPTFSSYSSDKLAEIAVRVTDEFKQGSTSIGEKATSFNEADELLTEDEDEFEFSLVRDAPDIFYDGHTKPIFPVFNLDLQADKDRSGVSDQSSDEIATEIPIPLKDLLMRERERGDFVSASSSEDEDLSNVPPGTYCVWRPKVKESSPNMCNKSNSTGSMSKRWKFLDLLRRSNSDGNESYVFLTPKHREKSEKNERPRPRQQTIDDGGKRAGKAKIKGTAASPSAHETFYVRNRAIKEGDKKKSYLPYRQVLVGFFANANGLRQTHAPL